MMPTPDAVEMVALAIRKAATRFDGDPIAVHLGNSEAVAWSTETAADVNAVVDDMCQDAARAALSAACALLMDVSDEMVRAAIDDGVRQGVAFEEDSPPLYFAPVFRAMLTQWMTDHNIPDGSGE